MQTTRFTRRHLPHWEVLNGRYFITVRCSDSLPTEAVERLAEHQRTLARIDARSPEFVRMQRIAFRTMELYLDAGAGTCPLKDASAAGVVVDEFQALAAIGVDVPHYTVMPNHWHALIVSDGPWRASLSDVMKRLKGRTAMRIRRMSGTTGCLWQREWFDRWIRDDYEWVRCMEYVHQNPVRAGIARTWSEHLWTR